MKILIDMDGVINNCSDKIIKKLYEEGYSFDKNFENEYNIEKGFLDKKGNTLPLDKQKKLLDSIFFDQSFWLSLDPIRGSKECLYWLNKKYEIYIATTPYRFTDDFINSKLDWLKKYYSFLKKDQVIFHLEKWTLTADVIIEDKPHTIEKCNQHGMFTIVFDQPYNKNVNASYRLYNWDLKEIQKLFREIEL